MGRQARIESNHQPAHFVFLRSCTGYEEFRLDCYREKKRGREVEMPFPIRGDSSQGAVSLMTGGCLENQLISFQEMMLKALSNTPLASSTASQL